jgi:hypothetical protein
MRMPWIPAPMQRALIAPLAALGRRTATGRRDSRER